MPEAAVLERRRGYYRTRHAFDESFRFKLGGHTFETDGKALWVTPPRTTRIDRIKVSRYVSDHSVRRGYPRELIRPEPMTQSWARTAAAFWLVWSTTPEAAAFPPVHLDHWVRHLESGSAPAVAAHMSGTGTRRH